MRNRTFLETLQDFFQTLVISFDVTGVLQQQLAATRKRRFEVLLRQKMRDARREARRQRMEEYALYDRMEIESEARRRAAQNLKSYRERLAAHRQHQDGFARDADALNSDWERINVDIQVVFDDFESKHPEVRSSQSLTHVAR